MKEADMIGGSDFGIGAERSRTSYVPPFRLDGSRLVFDDPKLNHRDPPPASGTRRTGKDKGRSKRKG